MEVVEASSEAANGLRKRVTLADLVCTGNNLDGRFDAEWYWVLLFLISLPYKMIN